MNEIARDLKSLRMPGMAQCWLALQETRKSDTLSFNDGLHLLLQSEQDQRKENRNARLIKDAHFRYQVYMEDLTFNAAQGLKRNRVMGLSTCDSIRKGMAITMARIESQLPRFFDRMAQTDLLLLDDFGMKVHDGQQLLDFMEIVEDRHAKKSTIIISQLPVADWYDVLKKNTTAADAILDRIVYTAHRFELLGDTLRKK